MRAALIWIGVAAAATIAHADDELVTARQLQATLEYDKALALVEAAIAHGGAEPDRLAELELVAGELTGGLDREADAERHFARALALRPGAALAPGSSPKLTTPLEAARARSVPLRVHATSTRGVMQIVVDDDALRMATGIAVRVADRGVPRGEIVSRDELRVAVPAGATALGVAALDADGNRIWIGPAPPELLPPIRHASPSPIGRPTSWAIATVALGVGAGLCAWRTSSLQADWNALRADAGAHDYSELAAVESRGRRFAIAADVMLVLATTTAITTVVLYVGDSSSIVASPTSVGFAARF